MARLSMRTLVMGVSAVLVSGLLSPVGSAQASADCAPVLIGVRGSGEAPTGNFDDNTYADALNYNNYDLDLSLADAVDTDVRGLGDKLQVMVRHMASYYSPSEAAQMRVEPLVYPGSHTDILFQSIRIDDDPVGGLPIGTTGTNYIHYDAEKLAEYLVSIDLGVSSLRAVLAGHLARCATQKFILAGYSQGAMVIHRTLNQLASEGSAIATPDHILALSLLADPLRRGGGVGDGLGDAPRTASTVPLSGSQGVVLQLFGLGDADVPAALESVTLNYCNEGDLVCATSGDHLSDGVAIHTNYGDWDMQRMAQLTALIAQVGNGPIAIPDAELSMCINGKLQLGGAPPTRRQLGSLLSLSCGTCGFGGLFCSSTTVASLEGLKFATNLQSLYVRGPGLSQTGDLGHLLDLRSVRLDASPTVDLAGLDGAVRLSSLDVSMGPSAVPTITGLPALRDLSLTGIEGDISRVDAPDLTSLELGTQHFASLAPLARFPKLQTLTVGAGHWVGDLTTAPDLPDLTSLTVQTSSSTTLEGLEHFPNLRSVSINNSVSDVRGVRFTPGLQSLKITNSPLSDVSPIAALSSLRVLDLSGNSIVDPSSLRSLPSVVSVNLDRNDISDLSGLGSMPGTVSAVNQTIALPAVMIYESTAFPVVTSRSGAAVTVSKNANQAWMSATIADGQITWQSLGSGQLQWSSAGFSGVFTREVRPALLQSVTPVIAGTLALGEVLSVDTTGWGPAPLAFTYQWYRDGVAIGGLQKSSFTLGYGDIGKQMTVAVTASKSNYSTVTVTSAPTDRVSAGPVQPGSPTLSGSPRVNLKLRLLGAVWFPDDMTYEYRWYRDTELIVGQSTWEYTLVPADAGKRISVSVTATTPGYPSVTRWTEQTEVVSGEAMVFGQPQIKGEFQTGRLLTVEVPAFYPDELDVTYQWYRDGRPITGATHSAFVPSRPDVGRSIRVEVTVSHLGYNTISTMSPATRITVRAADPPAEALVRTAPGFTKTALPPVPKANTLRLHRPGIARVI